MDGSNGAFAEIVAVEQAMRSLAEAVLTSTGDYEWFEQSGLSPDRIAKAKDRRESEEKSRRGVALDESPMRYLDIFDIGTIVRKNWDTFKPILGDRKRFDIYWGRLEQLRIALAHGRELLPFEEGLVQGMAGELRNVVTIYRSEMDPSGQYYPTIESVRDNFGKEWTAGPAAMPSVETEIRVEVGQDLEFRCRGWDPQSRELRWTLHYYASNNVLSSGTGNDAVLRYRALESDVGERFNLQIRLMSSGKYHRMPYWDDYCQFVYAVNPPDARA